MNNKIKMTAGILAAAVVISAVAVVSSMAKTKPRVPRLINGTTEAWEEEMPETTDAPETGVDAEYVSFAQKLAGQMNDEENWFLSPHSIYTALLMAANGADGETKTQLLDALGVKDLEAANEYAAIFREKVKTNDKITLETADSLWLNTDAMNGIEFSDSYKKLCAEIFDAAVEEVTAADAVAKVNAWVSEKTHGRIKDLISDNGFDAALVDTIYLKADWEKEFDKSSTYKQVFHSKNGDEKDIDFMHQTENFEYAESGDAQIAVMPYKGGAVSMLLILGEYEGDVEKLISEAEYSDSLLYLALPKISSASSFTLNDIMKKLGAVDCFDPSKADFKPMVTAGNMYIEEIIHKANVDVDEKGTEAAAATAIVVRATSMMEPGPEKPIEFICDRPFTYLIRDNETGEILFIGRYNNAE
ncbi:MAG: serpin family protein [Clostridiales bacterium]|nr:serpin family protein [Clostridiales bacterium]